jgi:hypothetical protein
MFIAFARPNRLAEELLIANGLDCGFPPGRLPVCSDLQPSVRIRTVPNGENPEENAVVGQFGFPQVRFGIPDCDIIIA